MRTKTVQRRLVRLVLGILALTLTYYYRGPVQQAIQSAPQAVASDYTVTETIDGDTIKVKMGDKIETIRFIGVDTPETHDPRKPVQCYGPEASAFTKQLLLHKQVRLEADPNDSDRDKYGRLLRYIYVGDTLINQELIKQGYGFAYVVFPFTRKTDFVETENSARAQGVGLWSKCQVNDSSKIKQTNSL